MKKIFIVIVFGMVCFLFFGCQDATDESHNDKLTIYTSIYPIQYAVERIGGDAVMSQSVYPPGVDAHTYEPTTKDMTDIAKGDAFIYLGSGMEGFAETAANALQETNVKRIELGRHKELFRADHNDEDDIHHHDHGDIDPHMWLDPTRLIMAASYIKDTLIELDPGKEKLFTANFESLKEDLIHLDEDFKSTLQNKDNKTILVSHAAYGYWEERYGIEQLPINGLSSSEEPSQRDLTKIIHQAESSNLHYVIFEQNASNQISEIIQDYIDAKALTIHNLSVLTDKDIENQDDYLTLMKKNLHVLDEVLN